LNAFLQNQGVFVTGTDTGVGKTLVSEILVDLAVRAGRRTAVMKPVAAGCEETADGPRNDDALALIARSNIDADYPTVNPYPLRPPVAPHIAAAKAGIEIDPEVLDHAFARLRELSDFVVVEGAGGFLVPLASGFDIADLAVRWQLPLILVVGLRLGCLNHALLSTEAIAARGLRLAGWIGNRVDPGFVCVDENIATLRERITAPCLGIVPYLGERKPLPGEHYIDLDLARGGNPVATE
jgi:dethiobiotin synthetase